MPLIIRQDIFIPIIWAQVVLMNLSHTKLISKMERMDEVINEDIPLFSVLDNEGDEVSILNDLIKQYRSSQ